MTPLRILQIILAGAAWAALAACTEGADSEPTPSERPAETVAGEYEYRDLLPESRRGIAPALRGNVVTRVPVTPTPAPAISEVLARRIADRSVRGGTLLKARETVEFIGQELASRDQLTEMAFRYGFALQSPNSADERFWVVTYQGEWATPLSDSARFTYAFSVVGAETGSVLVAQAFSEVQPIVPDRVGLIPLPPTPSLISVVIGRGLSALADEFGRQILGGAVQEAPYSARGSRVAEALAARGLDVPEAVDTPGEMFWVVNSLFADAPASAVYYYAILEAGSLRLVAMGQAGRRPLTIE